MFAIVEIDWKLPDMYPVGSPAKVVSLPAHAIDKAKGLFHVDISILTSVLSRLVLAHRILR